MRTWREAPARLTWGVRPASVTVRTVKGPRARLGPSRPDPPKPAGKAERQSADRGFRLATVTERTKSKASCKGPHSRLGSADRNHPGPAEAARQQGRRGCPRAKQPGGCNRQAGKRCNPPPLRGGSTRGEHPRNGQKGCGRDHPKRGHRTNGNAPGTGKWCQEQHKRKLPVEMPSPWGPARRPHRPG